MPNLRVRVANPLYSKRHLYANNACIPEYNDYEGTILPSSDPNTFRITTNDPQFPFRVIDKENIICGWLLSAVNNSIRLVESNNKTYVVNTLHNTCTCTGFSYRRTCSHIDQLS